MRLNDYLDKGATLGRRAACLTQGDRTYGYGEIQELSWRIGQALHRSGVRPGDKVAILSSNDAIGFTCVFGIGRAGAVWCNINPRNEARENQELLQLVDARCLIFQSRFAELVRSIRGGLPKLQTYICLDREEAGALSLERFIEGIPAQPWDAGTVDDVVMIAGTGGTTGKPKGVVLTGQNLETMTATVLMSYPFEGRPRYLALAPLTHAAGVLCFPIMALGGEVVVMTSTDLTTFVELLERHRVTHTMLPPTMIYRLLAMTGELAVHDHSSLQCLWYGAAPMSPARLEEGIQKMGPVFGQFFGQTEAPMMVSTMAPKDHFRADGSLARERLRSAGRPAPLTMVAIMDDDGNLLPRGEHGEIVIRGSLVMPAYYKNQRATEEASAHGWHHMGDVGYLDDDGFLFVVDRKKDMIITGGYNVYSVEVEAAILEHPQVQDCAVVGLPDEQWGERVTAVIQPHAGRTVDAAEITAFARSRLGSVKTPKQVEIWPDLPRSKVGKVVKSAIKEQLLREAAQP